MTRSPRLAACSALAALAALLQASCYDSSSSDSFGADLAFRHFTDVVAADLDGDGRTDIAFAFHDANGVGAVDVLINTTPSGASIATFAAEQRYGVAPFPISLEAGDLDGDGRLDFAITHADSKTFTIKLQDPVVAGTFPTTRQITLATKPMKLAIGDLDTDGRQDLAAAMTEGDTPAILFHDPVIPDAFLPPVAIHAGDHAQVVSAGDVDGDGHDDVVTGFLSPTSQGIAVYLQDQVNLGTFPNPAYFFTPRLPETLALADLDDDGLLDVATGTLGGIVDLFFQNSAAPGTLLAPVSLQIEASVTFQIAIAVGDLDGDAHNDLVVVNNHTTVIDPDRVPPILQYDTTVSILIQDTTGFRVYLPPVNIPIDDDTSSVAIGDFNDDGHPDLVLVGHNPLIESFTILFQDPAQPGTFGGPVTYPIDP